MSDSFVQGMFTSPAVEVATSDGSWVQAMLDVEAALVRAMDTVGLLPPGAARAIVAACEAGLYDTAAMREAAVDSATPVVPLVEALRLRADDPGLFVHRGATSQDIIDTAMMLLAKRTIALLLDDLAVSTASLAALAREHRETPMLARTLLQPALPTTFGLKCANWLDGLLDGRDALVRVRDERLALQFGGPAGTLDSLGSNGPRIAELMAGDLGLCAPDVPWHTNRSRIVELASALSMVAGASGKVAGDVLLMAQAEVAEATAGEGRSSSMGHKRNPAAAVITAAAARNAAGYAAMLLGLQVHEHERAAGSWQAEWQPFALLLRAAGGATHHLSFLLRQLEPDPDAMLRNLRASGVPHGKQLDEMGSALVFTDRVLDRYEATR